MDDDTPPAYVAYASPDWWQIEAATPDLQCALQKISFAAMANGVGYELRPAAPLSFEEAANIADQLRDIGLAFSAGTGWSPSQVMKDLRERKLCRGPFTEIYWTGPRRWHLRSV